MPRMQFRSPELVAMLNYKTDVKLICLVEEDLCIADFWFEAIYQALISNTPVFY